MPISTAQAKAFYDRFGSKQDAQGFYEDVALEALITHAGFGQAHAVFEFGCGTGRFAQRILAEHLPLSSSYVGMDLSETMIDLASQRLAPFGERARAMLSDGQLELPLENDSVDRVVSTYVLDLLSGSDVQQLLSEAHRVLQPDGKLCLVSLTHGTTLPSKIVSGVWSMVYQLNSSWVGGCRPINLQSQIQVTDWSVEYAQVVTSYAVPSEVLIAKVQKTAA
jgi:ubiquinone/menaquinone biosynthesis C-methylase UbiE